MVSKICMSDNNNNDIKNNKNNTNLFLLQMVCQQVLWRTETKDSMNYLTGSLLTVTRQDDKKYLKLFEYFGKAVVGVAKWQHFLKSQQQFSSAVSIADEAFMLLCIQSYKDKWIHNIHETVSGDNCKLF